MRKFLITSLTLSLIVGLAFGAAAVEENLNITVDIQEHLTVKGWNGNLTVTAGYGGGYAAGAVNSNQFRVEANIPYTITIESDANGDGNVGPLDYIVPGDVPSDSSYAVPWPVALTDADGDGDQEKIAYLPQLDGFNDPNWDDGVSWTDGTFSNGVGSVSTSVPGGPTPVAGNSNFPGEQLFRLGASGQTTHTPSGDPAIAGDYQGTMIVTIAPTS